MLHRLFLLPLFIVIALAFVHFSTLVLGQSGGLEPEQFGAIDSRLASAHPRSSSRKVDPNELPTPQVTRLVQPPNASRPPAVIAQMPSMGSQTPMAASQMPAMASRISAAGNARQPMMSSIRSQAINQNVLIQPRSSIYAPHVSPYEHAKPTINEPIKPHLFQFEPWQPLESCIKIVTELNEMQGQYSRSMLLYTILASVDKTAHDEPGENVRSDKDAVGALDELYRITLDTGAASSGHPDDQNIGLLPYIGRLIQCDADVETGRTLFQKFIEHGMVGALRTELAKWLAQGSEEFHPHLRLDKDGNTLLHLAVMSGSINTLEAVLNQESQRYPRTRVMSSQKSSLWVLSALNHQNNNGKTPLALSPTPGFKAELKKRFRNITNFLRKILQSQNLSSATMTGLNAAIGAVDEQMKSVNIFPNPQIA